MAATALQNVSTTCKDHMKTHCEGLIQIVQAIDTFNITNDSATGLLKGVATILATLPHDKCADGMRQLCSFQTNAMSKLLTEGSSLPKQGAADDPTVWLDRLAAVFRYTTPLITNGQVHPCLPVIQEVWPVLAQACTKYQADVRIVERCCRCIRFAIRCLGRSSSSLLTPLVPQMVSLYQVHSHSCFLYLGSILVDEYGATKEFTQGLLDMFQAFVGPTFKLLEEQNGLRNHPDTVDDLFRLSLRFIQRAPLAFLQSQIAKPVLCCAIAACSLDHKDANASVMKFITEIVKAATNKDEKEDFDTRSALVKGLLTEHGQSLVHALIHSIIFCLPTYMASDIGEVVYEVMLVDRPTFCVWLEAVLKALPTENTAGAISVTHKQLTDFHKAVTSTERVSETFCVWLEAVLKALPTENTAGAISVTHKQLMDFHKAVTSAERVSDVSDATFCVWLEAVLKALPTENTAGAISVTHKQLMDFHKAVTSADRVSDTFCVWLEAVLKALPTENTAGAISVTHKQLTDFHKAVTSAERVSDVSDAVREFARLYR